MPSSFKVGDRVRGRHTKRIGTISSSASPGFGGEARWNVYFDNDRTESCSERVLMPVEQDAVGVLDSLISAARAARYVGAISPADADSIITIAGSSRLKVHSGDFIRRRRKYWCGPVFDGIVFKVIAVEGGRYTFTNGSETWTYGTGEIEDRFEKVTTTPVEGS